MAKKSNSDGLNTAAPPRDLDSLRLSTDLLGSTVMTANLAKVKCEKPGNQTFIRSHPDVHGHYLMFERREESGTRHYLVDPQVAEMEEDARPILLQAYIARNGAISLWPLKLPPEDGNTNSWTDSAHTAREASFKDWIRIKSNRSISQYSWTVATFDLTPAWPKDLTLKSLIDRAFDETHIIRDAEHFVVQELLGKR